MVLTFEDLVRSSTDQMLTVLTSWQQGTMEAYAAWMKSIAPLIPDLNLYHEMPTAVQDLLGDPEKIIDDLYQFAIAVLSLQHEFVKEVFRSSFIAPLTPYVPNQV
ncbi:hypothetical protein GCM10011374_08830 [Kocuria dechangensis]|uniref:Uncharacterized protein n=1 Tax=Kocuria dechangensis TaxID=1176249 RepID=A0A917LP44_9MICC|nr:hypothetical protein [Kocuria dechangensis]GGG48646.1 hypothetical protein GCM10011374_08830 [Kocuria dechangensis]